MNAPEDVRAQAPAIKTEAVKADREKAERAERAQARRGASSKAILDGVRDYK